MKQTVEIPKDTGKITLKKQGDCTYVEYTYDRVYKEDKKYNIPKRKTIGKVCPDNPARMHPNKNFSVFSLTLKSLRKSMSQGAADACGWAHLP